MEVTRTSVIVRLGLAVFRRVLARADVALDLDMRAFAERRCELAELSPGAAAVPGGLTLAVAGLPVLPAPLGGKRQNGKRRFAGVGGADFGVFAEKSNESGSI